MSFNLKSLVAQDIKTNPVLTHVRKINSNDCQLLISLLQEYAQLDLDSPAYQKAFLSVAATIILQERVYFCLTRRGLAELMKNDSNYPENITKTFMSSNFNLILAKLTNVFNLFELVKPGDKKKRSAAVYKVSHPEILKYLQDKVDQNKQLNQCLDFSARKK